MTTLRRKLFLLRQYLRFKRGKTVDAKTIAKILIPILQKYVAKQAADPAVNAWDQVDKYLTLVVKFLEPSFSASGELTDLELDALSVVNEFRAACNCDEC